MPLLSRSNTKNVRSCDEFARVRAAVRFAAPLPRRSLPVRVGHTYQSRWSRHRLDMASAGDLRVLLALDLALSFAFSVVAVSALSLAGVTEFAWANVGVATLFLAAVTYVVVLR